MTPADLVKLDSARAKKMVKHYLAHMIKHAKTTVGKPKPGEYSVNSVAPYMAGVQSFLTDHLELEMNWKKIQNSYPEPVANTLRAHRRHEISKLLDLSDIRERTLVLSPVASGMRQAGKAELELQHLYVVSMVDRATLYHGAGCGGGEEEEHQSLADPELLLQQQNENMVVIKRPLLDLFNESPAHQAPKFPANSIGLIIVYGSSKKAKYMTPSTPEAMQSYIDYFQYRRERGEPLRPSTPLIRDKFGFDSKRRSGKPIHIKPSAINNIMRKLLRKANLPFDELQPDHGLRKFFDTMCANAGVDYMFKEMYMGHSIKLDKVYYDPENPESLRKIYNEYIKVVDLLTIDPKNRLHRENIQLKAQVKHKDMIISKYELVQQEIQNIAKVAADSARQAQDAQKELAELKAKMAMMNAKQEGAIDA